MPPPPPAQPWHLARPDVVLLLLRRRFDRCSSGFGRAAEDSHVNRNKASNLHSSGNAAVTADTL